MLGLHTELRVVRRCAVSTARQLEVLERLATGLSDEGLALIHSVDWRYSPPALTVQVKPGQKFQPILRDMRRLFGRPTTTHAPDGNGADVSFPALPASGDPADPHADHLPAVQVVVRNYVPATCYKVAEVVERPAVSLPAYRSKSWRMVCDPDEVAALMAAGREVVPALQPVA